MKRDSDDHDIMPIGAVVDLLRDEYPDVSHSSLRFLEREGLIAPARTPGGHRLFAPDDVQRVRRIKEWQAQRLSLEEIRQRLQAQASSDSPETLSRQFLDRALAGDLTGARRMILTASQLGMSLDTIFTAVLGPALWELGNRWARGEASVAQEKEVSETVRDLIAELELNIDGPAESAGGGVVAACVAGERHELGLRMVSGMLRARGVPARFLGADVDPVFLLDAVTRRRPDAVLLSVTGDEHLPALSQATTTLARADAAPTVFAGGQAVERALAFARASGVTPVKLDSIEAVDALAAVLRSAGAVSRPETAPIQ